MRSTLRITASMITLVAIWACEPMTSSDAAVVPVALRLAGSSEPMLAPPPDVEPPAIASATVVISRAYLVPADEDGEVHTIADEEQEFELLDLQGPVTALLGTADIPEGEYAQLRVVINSATVTLADGATFADGTDTKTLVVPSGMQSGIKVQVGGPLVIDGETDIVMTIDVSDNFVFQGPPGAPRDVLFTPVVKGTIVEEE